MWPPLTNLSLLLLFSLLFARLPGTLAHAQPHEAEVASLSLESALHEMMARDPSLLQARAHSREASALARQAVGRLLPRVDAGISLTTGNGPIYGFGTRLNQQRFTEADFAIEQLNTPDSTHDLNSSVTIEVPLVDVAGWFQVRAANRNVLAVNAASEVSEEELVTQTIATYLHTQLALEALQVADQWLETSRHDTERIQALAGSGMATEDDVLALRARLALAQERQQVAHNQVDVANARLNALLGRDLREHPTLSTQLDDVAMLLPTDAGNPSEHPARRAADAYVQARAAEYQATTAAWIPSVGALVQLDDHRESLSGHNGQSWMVGLNVRMNVFHGLQDRASRQAAEARHEAAEAQREATLRSLAVAEEQARLDLSSAQAHIATVDAMRNATEQAYEHERSRLDEGMSHTTSLLQRHSALLNASLRALQARYDAQLARVRLIAARGQLTFSNLPSNR